MESTRGATRYFSDDKGRVLSEEERAAENVYIQVNLSLIIRYVDFPFSSFCEIVEEEKLSNHFSAILWTSIWLNLFIYLSLLLLRG